MKTGYRVSARPARPQDDEVVPHRKRHGGERRLPEEALVLGDEAEALLDELVEPHLGARRVRLERERAVALEGGGVPPVVERGGELPEVPHVAQVVRLLGLEELLEEVVRHDGARLRVALVVPEGARERHDEVRAGAARAARARRAAGPRRSSGAPSRARAATAGRLPRSVSTSRSSAAIPAFSLR